MLETCAACGREVGYRHTVHVVLNPGGDEGVVDHYVCRSCYEEDLAPLFETGAAGETAATGRAETTDPTEEAADPDA